MLVTVSFQPDDKKIEVKKGVAALEAARLAGVDLSAVCGGYMECGSCVIKIAEQSQVNIPTQAEEEALGKQKLAQGLRLACQTVISGSVVINILPESRPGQPCRTDGKEKKAAPDYPPPTHDTSATKTPVPGMAVDIGTTSIAAYLMNMETGETLAQAGALNPQISFGGDVMARITYAMRNKEGGRKLKALATDAINSLAKELCRKAGQEFKPSLIRRFVIVGNTAMHHIFLGLSVRQLGLAPYTPTTSQALDIAADELGICGYPGAFVHLPPNIAGFIGSDHVSMLLASGIKRERKSALYMDIGANTEITLRVGKQIISCSAASGPAFEGAHIKDGVRASEGAIEQVIFENDKIRYRTIGNRKPVGICGSGIVDAVAQMLRAGIIAPSGSFNANHPLVEKNDKNLEVIIAPAAETEYQRNIVISRKDVSEIQLAKGAIGTAIELLLKKTSTSLEQIGKVTLAGAFGSFLNIDSARTIGLVPPLKNELVAQVGNAAGTGAGQVLIYPEKRAEAIEIKEQIKYLELAGHPEFLKEFTKAIGFGK